MKALNKLNIILFISCESINAQSWLSTLHIAGQGHNRAGIECIDASGDYYIQGTYSGNYCYLNQDTINATLLGTNTFVAKISPSGSFIWKHNSSSSMSSSCYSGLKMVYDSISNTIVFGGAYCSSIAFSDTTIVSGGSSTSGIIGKMDLSGNLIWSRSIVGIGQAQLTSIAYDASDNIYGVGTNTSPIQIDNDTLSYGTFLLKYSPTGVMQWAKNISGKGKYPFSIGFYGHDMRITGSSLYLSGQGFDTMNIDTLQFIFPNQAGKVISEFDLNGDLKWAKIVGLLTYGNIGTSMAMDKGKNIYTIYTIGDSAIFGNITFHKIGLSDIAIVKNDSIGGFIWVRQADFSSIGNGVKYISTDKLGDLYITGSFGGTVHFGSYTVSATNGYDMFLAKYDTIGNCKGAVSFGQAEGFSVLVDNNDHPIVSGLFYNTITVGLTTLTSTGAADAFIAKHDAITQVNTLSRPAQNQLLIHANPNTGKCNIRVPDEMMHEKNLVLSIYNSQGKTIQQIPVNTNEEKIKINLEAEATGIYNAVLSNGNKSYSGKIVFE